MTNQRKSMRFIGCLLAVFMLAVVFCLPALADSASSNTYTIPDTNMTVTIPEGATVLSVDTPAGDAAWSKAGILDASEKIKEMQKNRDHGGDYCGKRRYHSRSGEIFRLGELRF